MTKVNSIISQLRSKSTKMFKGTKNSNHNKTKHIIRCQKQRRNRNSFKLIVLFLLVIRYWKFCLSSKETKLRLLCAWDILLSNREIFCFIYRPIWLSQQSQFIIPTNPYLVCTCTVECSINACTLITDTAQMHKSYN